MRIRTLVFANSSDMIKYATDTISHAENLRVLSSRSRDLKIKLADRTLAVSDQLRLVQKTQLKLNIQKLISHLKAGQLIKRSQKSAFTYLSTGQYDAAKKEIDRLTHIVNNSKALESTQILREYAQDFLAKVPCVSVCAAK